MEVEEFVDVVKELRRKYQANKNKVVRGKRGELWLGICQNLFEKYGERFGYNDIHLFKRDLKRSQLILRVIEKRGTERDLIEEDEIIKNSNFGYGEGSTTFTPWQIRILGLNPDSY